MELIPVIDLRRGQAVMARHGLRHTYRPLSTPLCSSSDPLEVVAAYLKLHPFSTLYLADLDALLNTGDNGIIIQRIHQAFPQLTLWVDCGWPPLSPKKGLVPVVGSESLDSRWRWQLARMSGPWILSLDFNLQGFMGPEELLDCEDCWPTTVILMSLGRVGSLRGPDWQRLKQFRQRHPQVSWVAAGGIRGPEDVTALERLQIHRALVASALHRGSLPTKRAAFGSEAAPKT